jgi:hypothetical protein
MLLIHPNNIHLVGKARMVHVLVMPLKRLLLGFELVLM